MSPLERFKQAKEALKKGDAAGALTILNSVVNTNATIEGCPGCGTETLVILKSEQSVAECSSCGAMFGSKLRSSATKPLVKSGGQAEESMMKGRPDVIEKLWAVHRREDPTLTAYDINSYAMTGMISKALLERIGITVDVSEPLRKSEERTWGGLKYGEVLNTMLGMFKSGEEKTSIHRYSIAKFEQTGEIDPDVLAAILVKSGRDPNALSKERLSKSETIKIEDREGMDPSLEPGSGRKHEGFKNTTLGAEKLEEIRVKNPANGSDENEMRSPKEEKPIAKSLYFAPESGRANSWVAGTQHGIFKSNKTEDGFTLCFYPTKNNRYILSKNGFQVVSIGGTYASRAEAHAAAEAHHVGQPLNKALPMPQESPASPAPAAKMGPHFIFSAENALHPDKRTVKGDHDSVLSGIKAMGMDAHSTQGKYGAEEKSIMVMNPSKSHTRDLHSLAAGLGQESGLESDGSNHKLVYYHGPNAGKHHKGSGTEHFDASNKPDDYYTKHPTSDSHFRHNIDFDKLHDNDVAKSTAPAGVGAPVPKGDVLMKEPIAKAAASIAPPSVPGNKAIEASQSAAPEAKAHSLTAPAPKAPGMDDKIKALHAALGIKSNGVKAIKKSEAFQILEKKMASLKSDTLLGRQLLLKYAQLGVQIDLTKDSDWGA